jgi:hypothetical protein
MGKGHVWHWRREMSREDKRTFDRWLAGNAVAGAIFGAGLIAMAVLSWHGGPPSDTALATHQSPTIAPATVALKYLVAPLSR